MLWFNKRYHVKNTDNIHHEIDGDCSSIQVVALKSKAHMTAEQTQNSIDKLNKLLLADGITLKIHIATRSKRGN